MLSSQPEKGSPYLKSLPPWEELDYHRRRRRLRVARLWVTLTCSLLAGGFVAWSAWPGNHAVHQASGLAVAHASFNQDCARCHDVAFQPVARLVSGDAARSVSNETCNSCHHGADHNPQQHFAPDCVSCHREHRGKPVLSHVADAHCTDCHADLHRKDGQAPTVARVTAFATDHPEFAAAAPGRLDESRLRFNHKFHLELDLKALREQGRNGLDKYNDRLDCAACHQPDAARRYMQPIKYDKHCATCHTLSVQVAGRFDDPAANAALEAFRKQPAPHAEPPMVRAVLRERLVELVRRHPVVPAAPKPPDPTRFIPGQARALTESEWTWVKGRAGAAEEILFAEKELPRLEGRTESQCVHCHLTRPGPRSDGLPIYEPTRVPDRWMPKSVFRHDAHRMLDCAQCHGQALTSLHARDVLMPNRAACVQCHHPAGGARTDCFECHQYHDRKAERPPGGTRTIAEFLHGKE
jgi:hypothetical protein